MAEIKVNIKGDDEDLKAKFKRSAEEARVFKESVEKSLDAIKEASKTVVDESGLGGIAKLLGAAGLTGAAVEFSKKLVDGFKDAITAALDFGKEVGKLRSALGPAFGGQAEEWAKQIENISGAMGSFEENIAIFRELTRGPEGMLPEQALKSLIDMQNAAKVLGVDIGDLGERFAEMKERGEVPERFFHEFPQLAPLVRSLGGGDRPSVDWMFRTLLPAIAPGGLQAPIRQGAQQSIRGQIAEDMEQIHKAMIELGQNLLPLVNESLKALKAEMPEITELFHQLGEQLKNIIPPLIKWVPFLLGGKAPEHPFGEPLKPIHDWAEGLQDNIIKFFWEPAQFLKEAAAEHKAAAVELHRAVNPK